MAWIEKNTKAAFYQIKVVIKVLVSPKHQELIIDYSLALKRHNALKSFRQACSCWQKDYIS
jgi:hypothetical protein